MTRFFLVCVALLLTACADRIHESRKASMRNVAVISAIGDNLTLIRLLGDEEQPERVDWRFDATAVEVIQRAIRTQTPSALFVPVAYDPHALGAEIHKEERFKPFADPKRIERQLGDIIAGKSVDTIFLVARAASRSGLSYFEGVGIQTERTFLPRAPITPYANLILFIIDAPTMGTIAKWQAMAKGALYNVRPITTWGMNVGGDAPFLPGFKFPMTEEQNGFLRPLLPPLVELATQELMERVGF
jgi:hypothetical protein